MDGPTDGWTDKQTNGTDENYIPLWHTKYAGGIIKLTIMPKPHAHLQTMSKGLVKFQIDWYKTVGGLASTRYPQ